MNSILGFFNFSLISWWVNHDVLFFHKRTCNFSLSNYYITSWCNLIRSLSRISVRKMIEFGKVFLFFVFKFNGSVLCCVLFWVISAFALYNFSYIVAFPCFCVFFSCFLIFVIFITCIHISFVLKLNIMRLLHILTWSIN